MGNKRSGASQVDQLDDIYVYEVARRWLHGHEKVVAIAAWLVENHGDHLPWRRPNESRRKSIQTTRVKIYDILRIAAERGFFRENPPLHVELAEKLRLRFHVDEKHRQVTVVNTTSAVASDEVANAGAETALKLIRRLGETKERVHIALGAGYTGMRVAKRLGELVGAEPNCPKLALHALTSGFSVDNPLTAPVTFFRFFDETKVDIEFVGLFAAAFANYDGYDNLKGKLWIRHSFERAAGVDIVITSLATSTHEHGMLNQFLAADDSNTAHLLRQEGWIGDVQFLPYSLKGPIVLKEGIRAVTLFEFDELVRMTAAPPGAAGESGSPPQRHVVLVCGPCNLCGDLKTEALVPLMHVPALRVWSHLVTDARTAEASLTHPLA
jgi:hypothetical protein